MIHHTTLSTRTARTACGLINGNPRPLSVSTSPDDVTCPACRPTTAEEKAQAEAVQRDETPEEEAQEAAPAPSRSYRTDYPDEVSPWERGDE